MNDTWTCDCQYAGWEPDHRPCRRTFANGTDHWGMWCRMCGAWQSLAKSAVDVANADTYNPQRKKDAETARAEMRARDYGAELDEWRRWYFGWYLHTPHWAALRAAVLKRDPVCVGCDQVEAEHAHHLTYARLGCELLTDLVGMCRDCHARVHRHNRAMCPCVDCVTWRGGVKVPATMRVELADT